MQPSGRLSRAALMGALSAAGLWPIAPRCHPRDRVPLRVAKTAANTLWPLLVFATNVYLASLSFGVFKFFHSKVGMLHAFTISSVIAGIKPLINAGNILFFRLLIGRHRELRKQLARVEHLFQSSLSAPPVDFGPCLRGLIAVVTLTGRRASAVCLAVSVGGVVGATLLAVRVCEFVMCGEALGVDPMSDLSFVLVPLLSVWTVVPFAYFASVESAVAHCNAQLCRAVDEPPDDHAQLSPPARRRRFSLDKLYKAFCELTALQAKCGFFFGPWILFSLGWSVFTLCLTLYYCTQARAVFELPAALVNETAPADLPFVRLILYFNVLYSALQVVVSVACLATVCIVGVRVNESTREITKTVLEKRGNELSDSFQVTRFVFKMQMQIHWGVTVWSTFLLERSSCFTIVSLILTYTFLLLRLNVNSAESQQ